MNPREKRLLILLLVILGAGGASLLGYQWFYKPLKTYNAQIDRLRMEVEDKEMLVDMTRLERKLLERARMMSLSPHLEAAQAEYINFLAPVINKSGLEIEDFRITETTDTKTGPQNALKPGHRIVSCTLRAKGDLPQLVAALEAIQKTPLVHRVKTLSIDRLDKSAKNVTDKLNISMKIEAMMVGRAEAHVDGPLAPDLQLVAAESMLALTRGPTGVAMLPWIVGPTGPFARHALAMESGYRQYGDMERKNIFRGGEPPPKPPVVAQEDETPEDNVWEVAEYIRLDTADPDNREAYFRNLIFKMKPIRVRSTSWSGFNTFKIYANEFRSKTLFNGKVLRIDQRDVYFQVQEDVYGVHLGQSLADAMRRPLSSSELDRLELTRLYDAEWGAKEAKESLKQAQTAKKKGGGGKR